MTGILHIVFSATHAATLREALADRPDQEVLYIPDTLSLGPIDRPDPATRHGWFTQTLGCSIEDVGWMPAELEAAWDHLLGTKARRVFWYSRRWGDDWCGVMEALRRLGDGACHAIELTHSEFPALNRDGRMPRMPILGFAELRPDELRRFLDFAQLLEAGERQQHENLWARLRSENAPLRLSDGSSLRSAPVDAYDADLLALAKPQWQKVAMIIGSFWARVRDTPHLQAGVPLLAHRIRALVEQGFLESQGDLTRIRYSEVRLADVGRPH